MSTSTSITQTQEITTSTCSVSRSDILELLLKEFRKTSSVLRLLIAKTTFGLGVDCPDIDWVFNYGSP